jgi:hypothetical protein
LTSAISHLYVNFSSKGEEEREGRNREIQREREKEKRKEYIEKNRK